MSDHVYTRDVKGVRYSKKISSGQISEREKERERKRERKTGIKRGRERDDRV